MRGSNPGEDFEAFFRACLPQGEDPGDTAVLRVTLPQALRRLPTRQREAVMLRYLVGLGAEEVAQAMGVVPGTVRTHAKRGLVALREALGSDLEGDNHGLRVL